MERTPRDIVKHLSDFLFVETLCHKFTGFFLTIFILSLELFVFFRRKEPCPRKVVIWFKKGLESLLRCFVVTALNYSTVKFPLVSASIWGENNIIQSVIQWPYIDWKLFEVSHSISRMNWRHSPAKLAEKLLIRF